GFVDGDDALARGNHGTGGFGKLFDAHVIPQALENPNYSLLPMNNQISPRPWAAPSGPTSSRRSVLVAPWRSMWSPLVNTTLSRSASSPASNNAFIASRAASRVASPRLSNAIGNTSRTRAILRLAPACRDSPKIGTLERNRDR